MKKISTILAILVLALTLVVPAFAEDLPTYTFDTTMADWGTADITPFSYKYIVKDTGAIADMTYAGNDNLWNPGMKMYQATTNEAYCFAGVDCLHPAANASPAICFTAPESGKVTIAYVYYGTTTTRLDIFKNEYNADAKLKEQTPNNETTDFTIDVDVKKGDKILFVLDCLDDNASDQTPAWIKSATYTSVDASNPDTSDIAASAVVVAAAAIALGVVITKKH